MQSEPLLRYWTLHSPAGHVATCELVRTKDGLEVRCHWRENGIARPAKSAPIQAVTDALALAESWKAAYVEKGWVSQPSPNSRAN